VGEYFLHISFSVTTTVCVHIYSSLEPSGFLLIAISLSIRFRVDVGRVARVVAIKLFASPITHWVTVRVHILMGSRERSGECISEDSAIRQLIKVGIRHCRLVAKRHRGLVRHRRLDGIARCKLPADRTLRNWLSEGGQVSSRLLGW
jgi:Zn-dependent protease